MPLKIVSELQKSQKLQKHESKIERIELILKSYRISKYSRSESRNFTIRFRKTRIRKSYFEILLLENSKYKTRILSKERAKDNKQD